MAYTISTHTGPEVARGHNVRLKNIAEKQEHIDPDGVHEIWFDEIETQAYKRLFGDAVKEYNKTQPKCRQIPNYHAKIAKDAKRHTAYEMIISVGNKDNAPDPDTGKAVMKEFVGGWKERNPNLEMIGAYYHADEQGVPHVHIDYIPVAHGYKRGPEVQTGYARALDEMGFSGRNGGATWFARENGELEYICRRYGLVIEHPEAGHGVKHIHTEAYKATQEAAQSVSKAQSEVQAVTDRLNGLKAEYEAKNAVVEAAEDTAFYDDRVVEIKTLGFGKDRGEYAIVPVKVWDSLRIKNVYDMTAKKEREKLEKGIEEFKQSGTGKGYQDRIDELTEANRQQEYELREWISAYNELDQEADLLKKSLDKALNQVSATEKKWARDVMETLAAIPDQSRQDFNIAWDRHKQERERQPAQQRNQNQKNQKKTRRQSMGGPSL